MILPDRGFSKKASIGEEAINEYFSLRSARAFNFSLPSFESNIATHE